MKYYRHSILVDSLEVDKDKWVVIYYDEAIGQKGWYLETVNGTPFIESYQTARDVVDKLSDGADHRKHYSDIVILKAC